MANNSDPDQDLEWLMKTLGIHQFLPSTWLMEWLSSEVMILVVILAIIIIIIIIMILVIVIIIIIILFFIIIIKVCDEAMATAAVCRNILFLISGYNKAEMNSTVGQSSIYSS